MTTEALIEERMSRLRFKTVPTYSSLYPELQASADSLYQRRDLHEQKMPESGEILALGGNDEVLYTAYGKAQRRYELEQAVTLVPLANATQFVVDACEEDFFQEAMHLLRENSELSPSSTSPSTRSWSRSRSRSCDTRLNDSTAVRVCLRI